MRWDREERELSFVSEVVRVESAEVRSSRAEACEWMRISFCLGMY
jgi:hypothetical protein